MMSRAMGRKDFDTVRKSSAFGFYCAVGGGLLISLICGVFEVPILTLMGAEESTYEATAGYVLWTVIFGARAVDSERGYGLHGQGGGECPARQHRDHERLFSEHYSGSYFYSALGPEYGSGRSRTRYHDLQLRGLRLFLCTAFYSEKGYEHQLQPQTFYVKKGDRPGSVRRGGASGVYSESAERYGNDDSQQFYRCFWSGRHRGNGNYPEDLYGSHECVFWYFPRRDASGGI